jgi:ABC-type proline/glycine betaine transport system permease subunit
VKTVRSVIADAISGLNRRKRGHDRAPGLIALDPYDAARAVRGLARDREAARKIAVERHAIGASQPDIFIKVRFPQAVPSMVAGFKVAIALAVVGAVVGEFVGSRTGLGYYMLAAAGNFDTPLVFACVVVLTLMGVTLFYLIEFCESFLGRWNRLAADRSADEAMTAFGM